MGISYGFEGNEGAGKSFLWSLTKRLFQETTGFPVLAVREPGGTPLGEDEIRPILRNEKYKALHSVTNTLLYSAGRAELFFNRETPFLENNDHGILLKDRTWLSTIALQTVDGADLDYIMSVQKPFMSRPDKFIIIDIPVEETITRMFAEYSREKIGREPDWRDKQSFEVLDSIRNNYLKFVVNNRDKCMLFDCFDDPWVKAGEIKLDAVKTLGEKEGFSIGDIEGQRLAEFIDEAKRIVYESPEESVLVGEGKRAFFKPFDINKFRLEAEVARKELGYPNKEKLREQMHLEWQNLGIETNNGNRERFY